MKKFAVFLLLVVSNICIAQDSGFIFAFDPVIRDSQGNPTGNTRPVPPGWRLCDGLNGTPDLTDRFLMGVNSIASAGKYSGSNVGGLAGAHGHQGETSKDSAAYPHRVIHCSGNCYGRATDHKHSVTAFKNGDHNHGDSRPANYSVVYLCHHDPANPSVNIPRDDEEHEEMTEKALKN